MKHTIAALFFAFILSLASFSAYAEEHGAAPEGLPPEGALDGGPGFEYVPIGPITVPVIGPRGLTQQVSLIISVEVPPGKSLDVIRYKPRLSDAYIQDLYGALGAGYLMMKGNVVDVQGIKDRLIAVTDKVLGPDLKANSVLLQVVQQRAL